MRKFTYTDDGKKIVITFDEKKNTREYEYTLKDDILTFKSTSGKNNVYQRKSE